MSLPVVLTEDAQDDVADAHAWYEAQQPGRGDDFLTELQARFADIAQFPLLHARVFRKTRVAALPTSQFIVYYRAEPNEVVVTAVQHARANPRTWQRRK